MLAEEQAADSVTVHRRLDGVDFLEAFYRGLRLGTITVPLTRQFVNNRNFTSYSTGD